MTELERMKLERLEEAIKYNMEELNYSKDSVAMWLDGYIYNESADGSSEYFNTLFELRDSFIEEA